MGLGTVLMEFGSAWRYMYCLGPRDIALYNNSRVLAPLHAKPQTLLAAVFAYCFEASQCCIVTKMFLRVLSHVTGWFPVISPEEGVLVSRMQHAELLPIWGNEEHGSGFVVSKDREISLIHHDREMEVRLFLRTASNPRYCFSISPKTSIVHGN